MLGQPLHKVDALRATLPAHLRHAPTVSEIRALLQVAPPRAFRSGGQLLVLNLNPVVAGVIKRKIKKPED